MRVKEVKPVEFCPLSLLYIVRLFRFYYFRRFCHSERGIKSLRLRVTCIDLHWFLFCGRIWPFLLLPGRTCRTWTILWTARLLSKSDQGMATPELIEAHNDDDVVDINCVALYYEKLRRQWECISSRRIWSSCFKTSEDLESLKRNSQVSRPEFTAI